MTGRTPRPGGRKGTRRAEAIYRTLLRVLPRSFRDEAEAEMLQVFREGWAAARGPLSRASFWAVTVVDLLLTLVAEVRRSPHGTSPGVQRPMTSTAHDLQAAARRLTRHPLRAGFSAGVLAVGVAATVLVLTLVRDIVIRPLPFSEPDRLVRLRELPKGKCCYWPSFPNFEDWREQATVFSGVIASRPPTETPILLGDHAVRGLVSGASKGFFPLLGVQPALGRSFSDAEDAPGGAAVAVVSWRFWTRELGSASLDQRPTLTVEGELFTVVGVLPRDFRFLGEGGEWQDVGVWTPLERSKDLGGRTSHGYHVVARLAPGVDLSRARAAMDVVAHRLKSTIGEPTDADQVLVTSLKNDVVGGVRRPLRMLLLAAVGVLLVACLNLAASLLAQGLGRLHELSIRSALGATRAGLARQMLAESLLTALPATVAGLAAAWAALAALRGGTIGMLPRMDQVSLDGIDIAVGLSLGAVAALAAGLIPAVLSARRSVGAGGARGSSPGRESQLLWRFFVGGEAAMTMVLLMGCGLLLRSFVAANAVDLGYDPHDVLSVDIPLPDGLYEEPARRLAFYEQALRAVRALPGVEVAGLTNQQPYETSAPSGPVTRAGHDASAWTSYRFVDPGYFEALRIPRLSGTQLTEGDPDTPDIAIDTTLVNRLWPEGTPLGDALGWPSRIVAVMGSVREWNQEEGIGAVYVDYRGVPGQIGHMVMMIRHAGDPASIAASVRGALATIDPLVPIQTAPLPQLLAAKLADRRVMLLVALVFAAVALLLAATGIYAVVSFAVHRRTREAAIRMSLGAGSGGVVARMMTQGMGPAVVGVLVGLGIAYPVGQAMRAELFHVRPFDTMVTTAAAVILATAATVASWVPSRRAASVDPATTLQGEYR